MFDIIFNLCVGCVIVKDWCIIGVGFIQLFGGNYVEIQVMVDVVVCGQDVCGVIVYVMLELCSYFGCILFCVDVLVCVGVVCVVVVIVDFNLLVVGQGLVCLQVVGIEVVCGLLEEEVCEINIGFLYCMCIGCLWVCMKSVVSLDGKIVLYNGVSQWIISQVVCDDGYIWCVCVCVIMVGIGIIQKDDV